MLVEWFGCLTSFASFGGGVGKTSRCAIKLVIDFDDKLHWFRDDSQRERVRAIVLDRLADDHNQEECRYLMRFWWHLVMGYREVSYDQLHQNCTLPKMAILDNLFSAIASGFDAVDAWIDRCESELPIVVNRVDEMQES